MDLAEVWGTATCKMGDISTSFLSQLQGIVWAKKQDTKKLGGEN